MPPSVNFVKMGFIGSLRFRGSIFGGSEVQDLKILGYNPS